MTVKAIHVKEKPTKNTKCNLVIKRCFLYIFCSTKLQQQQVWNYSRAIPTLLSFKAIWKQKIVWNGGQFWYILLDVKKIVETLLTIQRKMGLKYWKAVKFPFFVDLYVTNYNSIKLELQV